LHARSVDKLYTEIRNRIYDFCEEELPYYSDHPGQLRKIVAPKGLPKNTRSRTFFSLTQACKQIRLEYRPLWLRQSVVLVDFIDLKEFLSTFYHIPSCPEAWYRDAPRELTVSWDHDMTEYGDNKTLIDIRLLLKLHAYSPRSIITFKCRRLLDFDLPCVKCDNCGACIHSDGYSECHLGSEATGHFCEHEDTINDVFASFHAEYEYLRPLNEFLGNSNTKWLKEIQDMPLNSVELACTMGENSYLPTIYIRFQEHSAPEQLQTRDMYRCAVTYLTEMGMADLEDWQELHYVVGVQTNKWTRHIHGWLNPVCEQALIHGEDLKAPSTTTED